MKTSLNSKRGSCILVWMAVIIAGGLTPHRVMGANKNVYINQPASTQYSANTMLVHVGDTVNFQATTSWPSGIDSWIWSPGDVTPVGSVTQQVCNATKTYSYPYEDTVVAQYNGEPSYVLSVIPVQADLKSIKFTSDHAVLRDNKIDWSDFGNAYTKPEWVPSLGRNNPISQTKNTTLTADVTVNVQPSGLTFGLSGGDGVNSYFSFSTTGASTGGDQVLSVSASAALPNSVSTYNPYIYWSMGVSNALTSGFTSGQHKMYITYGTPTGSVVTEMRLSDVCSAAAGWSDADQCASAISGHLAGFRATLLTLPWGPDPVWLLHTGYINSECAGLALFISKHFDLLGLGSGSIKFCVPLKDGTYDAKDAMWNDTRGCTPGNYSHTSGTGHDAYSGLERLLCVDGSGGVNSFEATCLFRDYFFAVGAGIYTTPSEVVGALFGSRIGWWYYVTPSAVAGCPLEPWPNP